MATALETNKTAITTLEELVKSVWSHDVRMGRAEAGAFLDAGDGECARTLKEERIVVIDNNDGTITFSRRNAPCTGRSERRYEMPEFADEVRAIVRRAVGGQGMANLCLTGQMGTGKTEFVYELAREFGVKVYQVNGSDGLRADDFYGTMAVAVDGKSGQNYTRFEKGPLYRAFIEGTMLDCDGNQVLDGDGSPVVIGKPAFFFLDEFAAMLPEVFLGVFNRAMEIPRKAGASRSIEITMDNGRVVKSHPGLVMFLAGNTVGTGNSGRYQMGFTAQSGKMDESTRNRITGFYRFGYNRSAESRIALGILNDDYETDRLMKFRDSVRGLFRNEKVETLFTTRSIIAACEMAVLFRAMGKDGWMARALKAAVYEGLPESDRDAFNETVRMIYGADYNSSTGNSGDYDYL